MICNDISYLPVRNYQIISVAIRVSSLCQIPGHEERTPQIIDRRVQFLIGQFWINFFLDDSAIYQLFQFHFCQFMRLIHTFNKMTDHTVSACIRPVVLRCKPGICLMITAEINHIPRTINFYIPKPITIVPCFYCLIIFFLPVILKEFSYFTICTRAAIEGGLDYDSAYQLSDYFIQSSERLSSIERLYDLLSKVGYSFAEKVANSKTPVSTDGCIQKTVWNNTCRISAERLSFAWLQKCQ